MKTTFNGDAALHSEWVASMEAHAAADRLVQKLTGEDGRGCFIYCAAGAYDTAQLQAKTGIAPRMAKLLEGLFEGLEQTAARQFAMDVTHAIPCGVVLDDAIPPFLHWLMSELASKTEEGSDVRKAVEQVRDLYANGWPESQAAKAAAWTASWTAAWEAARAAEAASWTAAWTAARTLGITYTTQAEALLGFIRNLKPNQ